MANGFKRLSHHVFVGDGMSPDEIALINHIREVREGLAGTMTTGDTIAVVVVTATDSYMFWRTATALETSEDTKSKLGVE